MADESKSKPLDVVKYYKDVNGEWRWHRFNGSNNELIGGATEGYENKDDAEHNAETINGPEGEHVTYEWPFDAIEPAE